MPRIPLNSDVTTSFFSTSCKKNQNKNISCLSRLLCHLSVSLRRPSSSLLFLLLGQCALHSHSHSDHSPIQEFDFPFSHSTKCSCTPSLVLQKHFQTQGSLLNSISKSCCDRAFSRCHNLHTRSLEPHWTFPIYHPVSYYTKRQTPTKSPTWSSAVSVVYICPAHTVVPSRLNKS